VYFLFIALAYSISNRFFNVVWINRMYEKYNELSLFKESVTFLQHLKNKY